MRATNILTMLFLGAAFCTFSPRVEAAQRTVVAPTGKTHVVHDELGPVLMHRIFPPYKGIHIHSSELQRVQASGRRR